MLKTSKVYLPLLLIFIFGDVLCDNSIFRSFHNESYLEQILLFLGALLLQVVSAPIQAGLSDFYGRRVSLIFSLFFSCSALLLQYLVRIDFFHSFAVIFLLSCAKGMFGNTLPLAWASIADTKEKNVRFSFALSTGSMAIAYLVLVGTNKFLSPIRFNEYTIYLYAVIILLCIFFFRDVVSPKNVTKCEGLRRFILKDMKGIIADLLALHTRNALIAFFLWEISIYCILLLYIDFDAPNFSAVAFGMILGYIVGVAILKLCTRLSDKSVIKLGYNLSTISLIPFFVVYPFMDKENFNFILLSVCYFLHMMGNAFLSATLFSILAKERKPSEQGKIYGLIASVDTIAFLLSCVFAISYNLFRLKLIVIILFSFLTVAISWFPYARFEKFRPKS
jgi:MFS family permease